MESGHSGDQKTYIKITFRYAIYRCVVERSGVPLANYLEQNWGTIKNTLKDAPGFVILLAAGFLTAGYCWNIRSITALKEQAAETKMLVSFKYEIAYINSKHDKAGLVKLGRKAFEEGRYAYAVKSFEQAFTLEGDGECRVNCFILYAAGLLALNPTPEGHIQFHQMLENMLLEVQVASTNKFSNRQTGEQYLQHPLYLGTLIENLDLVERRLTDDSEKNSVGALADQIIKFKKMASVHK